MELNVNEDRCQAERFIVYGDDSGDMALIAGLLPRNIAGEVLL
jgi:hypothetical protein